MTYQSETVSPVGERLALLAQGKVYGEDVLCEPPEATGVRIEAGRLVISFAHAGQGLTIKGSSLQSLTILVDGKEVIPYAVSVGRDTVTIQAESVQEARTLEVRYAYRNYAEVNLYNSAGLPAVPFRLARVATPQAQQPKPQESDTQLGS